MSSAAVASSDIIAVLTNRLSAEMRFRQEEREYTVIRVIVIRIHKNISSDKIDVSI